MVMSRYQMSATTSFGSMASRKKLLAASAGPTWLRYKTRSALVMATYATLRDSRVCSKHCQSGNSSRCNGMCLFCVALMLLLVKCVPIWVKCQYLKLPLFRFYEFLTVSQVLPDRCGHRQMWAQTDAGKDRCKHRQDTSVQLVISVKQAIETHRDSDSWSGSTCHATEASCMPPKYPLISIEMQLWLLSSDIRPHHPSRKHEEACLLQVYPRGSTRQVVPGFSVQPNHETHHALQTLDGMHAAQHQLQPEEEGIVGLQLNAEFALFFLKMFVAFFLEYLGDDEQNNQMARG